MITNVFTPDKGADTKEYFIKKMPVFFILLALFFGSQFLFDLHESNNLHIIRLVVIGLLIVSGLFYRKVWVTYVFVAIWLIAIIIRGNMILA